MVRLSRWSSSSFKSAVPVLHRQPRVHMTSSWHGPMEASALSLRRRSQGSIPRLRSGLFASQFRGMCNLQVVASEGSDASKSDGDGGPARHIFARRGLRVGGSG